MIALVTVANAVLTFAVNFIAGLLGNEYLATAGLLISVVCEALVLLGFWRMTTPPPERTSAPASHESKRVMVRRLTGLSALGLLGLLVPVVPFASLIFGILVVFAFVGGLARIIVWLVSCSHLANLASRIPNEKLEKRGRFLPKAFLVCGGVFAVGFSGFWVSNGPGSALGISAAILMGVSGLTVLILSLSIFFYFSSVSKAIKKEVALRLSMRREGIPIDPHQVWTDSAATNENTA